ncbi:Methionyl-tRNA synthetase [Prochlorococcus marinus str. MIT 9515]|uniref:Methionine--tRNA ligase n=1 Tax=Prochlorococcus marinus (strain MIT 9515) TaxID=167542 RepID=A2BWJ4_PROM5|nr:methionine--tRNA ligase [Prochlorococcus marinus]ABM72155.1 Methionyl-tRNA synthetase [Prochlorococcus marinus str. MIT 9515]
MSFVITTPLYYVNDKPHLGSIYTTLICDSIARFKRLSGDNVIFITGVDEHGLKIQRTASNKGVDPQSHCDEISDIFKQNWKSWDITNNKFVRTSSQNHESIVNEFYNRVKASGDIYMGVQKGWYCVGCEEFKENPENLSSYKCPIHQKNLEWKNEENLFFRLSKYQSQIEELINEPSFIYPKERRNEIINFVSKGLKDFSVSRTNVSWGISVPDTKDHTFYVWFDALLGYVSAICPNMSDPSLESSINNGWPADIHFIGKDILRFHAVYWPAMLLSAGMDVPKRVFGHGFLTREGQKMGKSLGNVLDPNLLLSKYGKEAVRWYLLKDISLGSDGDFQNKRFVDIINNDLANTIGNLLNRTSSMSRKWFDNKVPDTYELIIDNTLQLCCNEAVEKFINHFNLYELDLAANVILNLAINTNLYLNEKQPWKLIKDENNISIVCNIIYDVLESTRIIGLLLLPILPDLSSKINMQLGSLYNKNESWNDQLNWGLLKSKSNLPAPYPIIEKLEYE